MVKLKSDLTKNLRKIIKNKKLSVFIDAGNLYHSAVKSGIKLDFARISQWFEKYSKEVSLHFYTAFNPDNQIQLDFLDYLEENKYKVNKKPIKIFKDLSKKGNMDIELAVDAIDTLKDYDMFILFSGDGDFHYLVKYLQNLNKEGVVLSLGGFTSYELHQDADNYFFLDRISSVWRKPITRVQKVSTDYQIFIDEVSFQEESKDTKKNANSTKQVKRTKKSRKPLNSNKEEDLKIRIHI